MTPDTNCAIRMPGSEFPPNGYAMISRRAAQRASLLIVCRAAWGSTPNMGIERSSFSRRTVFFLLILFAPPITARCDSLEDSARELARKIAASLPAGEDVSLEAHNNSTLPPNEFAGVERTLSDELENLEIPVVTTGAVAINLKITVSENLKGLLLTAEISQAGASQVILMEASGSFGFHITSYLMPVVLHSKIIWEGPEQILDAATASGPGGIPRLVLLLQNGVEIHDSGGRTVDSVTFPFVPTPLRDPRGKLETSADNIRAKYQSEACTVSTDNSDTYKLLECHQVAGTLANLSDEGPHEFFSKERGAEILMPQNGCGAALATGPGDYTQMDWIQGFSVKPAGLAISNKLDFPGPVLALRGGPEGSRAIVHNLKTGNYEAYSLSCGK